jgi:hypothetical protein
MIRLSLVIVLLIAFVVPSKADEGMWIPALLKQYNIKDMKKAGFKLSAKDVYDINKACLKDAVIGLSSSSNPMAFWASGSFISESGLVLTNHHCAVSFLHKHSSEDQNYLKDGFYADSQEKELPAKGLSLARLVSMKDVTTELLAGTEKLNGAEKARLIDKRAKEMAKKAELSKAYKVRVKSYFGGGQYFLEVFELYKDVRIVAMPALSVGKFGGEYDNWAWPRQSADFAILRVYGNSNNESLKYSVANQPVKPAYHLEVAKKSYKEDDFAMVFGFPGSTKQFLTARALKQLVEVTNHHSIKIREAKLDIIEKAMSRSDELWLKYADMMAKTSNRLLRWKAESAGIERFNVIEEKKAEEASFKTWTNSSDELKAKYGNVIDKIEGFCNQLDTLEKLNSYIMEAGINGANITSFVGKFDMLNALSSRYKASERNQKRLLKELRRLRVEASNFYYNFDMEVEKEMLSELVRLYDENVGDELKPAAIVKARREYNGDFKKYMDDVFEKSVFTSKERLNNFLKYYSREDVETLKADPLFELCISYYLINRDHLVRQRMDIRRQYGKFHQMYVQANREMKEGEKLAADANRSLRVSFGKIKGFKGEEKTFAHNTMLSGLLAKNLKDAKIYELPQEYQKSVEEYLKSGKDLNTCFITNSHTTGGSSGSPVLNAKGKLIGLNFDSVGYGLISDYKYKSECSRQIAVDIRYIQFVLEHQLNAKALLNEWLD